MDERLRRARTYLVIGSLVFGMLFGAGNLVFPVHLGQLAGRTGARQRQALLLPGSCCPCWPCWHSALPKAGGSLTWPGP